MKAYIWPEKEDGDQGIKFETTEIPDALLDEAKQWRRTMLEAIAEYDDEFMAKYLEFENQEFPAAELKPLIRKSVLGAIPTTKNHLPPSLSKS